MLNHTNVERLGNLNQLGLLSAAEARTAVADLLSLVRDYKIKLNSLLNQKEDLLEEVSELRAKVSSIEEILGCQKQLDS